MSESGMAIFTDIEDRLDALRDLLGEDVDASAVPTAVRNISVDAAYDIVVTTAAIMRQLIVVQSCAAGVVAEQSTRDLGHSGFAQMKGHRSPVSLVQEVTGSSRSDAVRRIRVGESLLEATAAGPDVSGSSENPPASCWHALLSEALMAGRVTSDQHDAIRRGLGEPPVPDGASDQAREWTVDAWRVAGQQRIAEAAFRTVEELRVAARAVRDTLDPEGAARRFDERFARRSFRTWTDADGVARGSFVFDDEAAAWVRSILDAALRPRRGGPRFVDATEAARAEQLETDPRTNDQLAYDLIIDVLRAGALADAADVFGTRQAGVRVVITAAARQTASGDPELGVTAQPAVGHCEDGGETLPGWLIEQHACDAGESTCIADRDGNPLYLGRESRLFSAKQKIALALRDGGCRWRGCDRPASYCESHHIDHYADQHGRTDIDRGILLCRWHHMHLHHHGWQITRHDDHDFMLHPPDNAEPITLPPRLALHYTWNHNPPPDKRFRRAA